MTDLDRVARDIGWLPRAGLTPAPGDNRIAIRLQNRVLELKRENLDLRDENGRLRAALRDASDELDAAGCQVAASAAHVAARGTELNVTRHWRLYPVQSAQIDAAADDDHDHAEWVIRVDGPLPKFPVEVVPAEQLREAVTAVDDLRQALYDAENHLHDEDTTAALRVIVAAVKRHPKRGQ